ncbi:MAG: hypothetical protein V9G20_30165 [Candidatus Promineifilaceae bacterium]
MMASRSLRSISTSRLSEREPGESHAAEHVEQQRRRNEAKARGLHDQPRRARKHRIEGIVRLQAVRRGGDLVAALGKTAIPAAVPAAEGVDPPAGQLRQQRERQRKAAREDSERHGSNACRLQQCRNLCARLQAVALTDPHTIDVTTRRKPVQFAESLAASGLPPLQRPHRAAFPEELKQMPVRSTQIGGQARRCNRP